MIDIRIGYGYDVHQFSSGRKLILGGIEIPHDRGLLGHSDADVLLHAITDAILGALALGDIGTHFPDTEKIWKDADSAKLLQAAYLLVTEKGYQLSNIDSTVVAEAPKLNPYIPQMQDQISKILNIGPDRISIKATTSEKMGFVGRGEGVAAMSTILLIKS
ncbi:MAG TPA: 2-C-methyl-D-erythritol 2,4-cyclodiphosphate synthase [Bacteroidetes bacterium]|nr:2-C-methyl-D-erythritol 2,4-cyclodiphosphate synthase [Bacteroidota bacterium]